MNAVLFGLVFSVLSNMLDICLNKLLIGQTVVNCEHTVSQLPTDTANEYALLLTVRY